MKFENLFWNLRTKVTVIVPSAVIHVYKLIYMQWIHIYKLLYIQWIAIFLFTYIHEIFWKQNIRWMMIRWIRWMWTLFKNCWGNSWVRNEDRFFVVPFGRSRRAVSWISKWNTLNRKKFWNMISLLMYKFPSNEFTKLYFVVKTVTGEEPMSLILINQCSTITLTLYYSTDELPWNALSLIS